jgi:hypothetical protein
MKVANRGLSTDSRPPLLKRASYSAAKTTRQGIMSKKYLSAVGRAWPGLGQPDERLGRGRRAWLTERSTNLALSIRAISTSSPRFEMPDGVVLASEQGIPQSSPLSRLSSNLALGEVDWEFAGVATANSGRTSRR